VTAPMIDELITTDLLDLATASEHPRVAPTGVFRTAPVALEGRAGRLATWCAQRAAYAGAWTSVYASRIARAVTGGFAVLVALLHAKFISEPDSVLQPAWNIGGTLALIAVVYAIVWQVAAGRFRRGARSARFDDHPEPGSSLLDAARTRVERLDRWATTASVAGMVTLLPTLAYYLGAREIWANEHGAPVASFVVGSSFTITAVVALLPAIWLGSIVRDVRTGGPMPGWVRWLERSTAALYGLVLGALALFLAHSSAGNVVTGDRPSSLERLALASLAQVAIVLVAGWFVLRLLRREQDLLERAHC
jgi:hypothetical protein